MKKAFLYFTGAFLSVIYLSSCKDELRDVSMYTNVYMSQAGSSATTKELELKDTVYQITYGASYGGLNYNYEDIHVTFKTDPSLLSAYNLANGTNYEPLPTNSYEFVDKNGIIKKGNSNSDPLKLKITPFGKLDVRKEYMLPISIEQVTGPLPLSEKRKTTYFHFKPFITEFNKSKWTIAAFSSEETVGQPAPTINQGYAVNAIDGNINTYWHSAFNNGGGFNPKPLPHWLVVDMHETKNIQGFSLLPRNQTDATPKTVKFEVSKDNLTWELVGLFTLVAPQGAKETLYLSTPLTGRYFKFSILTTGNGNPYSHVLELYAF